MFSHIAIPLYAMPEETYTPNSTYESVPDVDPNVNPNPDPDPIASFTNTTQDPVTITVSGDPIVLKPGESAFLTETEMKDALNHLPSGTPVSSDGNSAFLPTASGIPAQPSPLTSPDAQIPLDAGQVDSSAKQGSVQEPAGIKITNEAPKSRTLKSTDKPTDVSKHRGATPQVGDPVNPFTGAFEISDTDVVISGGVFDLAFTRNYKSGILFAGPLGWGWDHNHNSFIRAIDGMTDTFGRWNGDVHEDLFVKQSGGDFLPPPGVFDYFEEVLPGSYYRITKPGGTKFIYNNPDPVNSNRIYLTSITDLYGNRLTYDYAVEEGFFHLTQVTEVSTNKALYFHYGSCGLLERLTDDYDRVWKFYHDSDIEHHIGVQYPPCLPQYPNGYIKQYDYSDAELTGGTILSHAVVRVYDGDGNTFIYNEYDPDPASYSYGRVVAQLAGKFNYLYEYEQIQWAPQIATQTDAQVQVTSVQMPDGSVRSYTFNYRGDLLEQRIRLVKDGTDRVITSNYVYDHFGRLTSYVPVRIASSIPYGPNDHYYEFTYNDNLIGPTDIRDRSLIVQIKLNRLGLTSTDRWDTFGHKVLWKGEYTTANQLIKATYAPLPGDGSITPTKFKTAYGYDALSGIYLETITLPDVTMPDGTSQAPPIIQIDQSTVPGRLSGIIDPNGKSTKYLYGTTGEATGRLTQIIYDYGVGGMNLVENILYSTDPTPANRNYGMPVSDKDPTGYIKKFSFNSMGRIAQVDLPSVAGLTGRMTFEYDADGFITAVTSPKGDYTGTSDAYIKTVIDRDVMREIKKITTAANTTDIRVSTQDVNYQGLAEVETNAIGASVRRVFDERGLLLREQANGSDGVKSPLIRYKYDAYGNLCSSFQSITTNTGATQYNKTEYLYDGYMRLSSVKRFDDVKRTVEFNWVDIMAMPTSKLFGIEDNNPIVIETSYDASGNIVEQTISEYNKRGKLIQVREADFATSYTPNFLTTQYFYDLADNLFKIIGPRTGGIQISTFTYDALNRLTKAVDAEGNIREYTYDGAGRLLTEDVQDVNSPYSHLITTYGYDPDRMRLVSVTTPDGVTFKTEYDDRDLPVTSKLPATFDDATERRFLRSFGATRELLSTTEDPDLLNLVNTWIYNKVNQPIQYQDPSGSVTTYFYDSLGRTTGVQYPDANTVAMTYDIHGRPYQTSYSYGTTLTSSYYESGLLQSLAVTPGAGLGAVATHHYEYDALNRLTRAYNGTSDISRTYDSLSRMKAEITSSLTLSQDYSNFTTGAIDRSWSGASTRTERFTLDKNNFPIAITRTLPGPNASLLDITSMYGPDRIKTATQLAGTITMNAKYDDQKRLYQLAYTFPGETETLKYRYDSRSRRRVETVTSTSLPATNVSSENDLDNRDRLTNTKTGTFAITGMATTINTQANHDSDIVSNVQPALSSSPSESFVYSASGVDKGDGRVKYTDIAGNVISYTLDAAHAITNAGINGGTITYAAGGTRKQDGGRNFTIDGLGRITSIADRFGSQTLSVSYDALMRPWKLDDGVNPVRELNYFGSELVQETVSGAADRRYTNHPSLGRIATHTATNDFQHLYDARQNLIATLDSIPNIREVMRYDPFGFPKKTTVGTASGIEPVFGGMRYLSITGTPSGTPTSTWPAGLYLGMHRIYDPSMGVWLSPDPLEYTDGPNRSAYVTQNPVNFIDPMGLSKREDNSQSLVSGDMQRNQLASSFAKELSKAGSKDKTMKVLKERQILLPNIGAVLDVLSQMGGAASNVKERRSFVRRVYPNAPEDSIIAIAHGQHVLISTEKDAKLIHQFEFDQGALDEQKRIMQVEFDARFKTRYRTNNERIDYPGTFGLINSVANHYMPATIGFAGKGTLALAFPAGQAIAINVELDFLLILKGREAGNLFAYGSFAPGVTFSEGYSWQVAGIASWSDEPDNFTSNSLNGAGYSVSAGPVSLSYSQDGSQDIITVGVGVGGGASIGYKKKYGDANLSWGVGWRIGKKIPIYKIRR